MVLPDAVSFTCQYTIFLHIVLSNYQRNKHKVVYSNVLHGVGVIGVLNSRWNSKPYLADLNQFCFNLNMDPAEPNYIE